MRPALFFLFCACFLASQPQLRAAEEIRTLELDDKKVEFVAQPGTIDLPRDDGSARASIYYTAYKVAGLDEKKLKRRPVAFLFNGGPGSSSAWLHLGAFGPQRLVLGKAGLAKPEEPYRTVANKHSLLDVADLVFIDPVSTGFSRAADPIAARRYYSFRGDVRAVAEFINRYMEQEERRDSPCFLIGESYGAMRACGLVPELEAKHGIVVNGIVLVSGPIVMGRRSPADLMLPTVAAISHYHGLLGEKLQALGRGELLREVDQFVEKAFRPALEGKQMDRETRQMVESQLRSFAALPEVGISELSLREWRSNTLRKLGAGALGGYDARVVSERRRGRFRGAGGDPAMDVIRDPMEGVMERYLTDDLGYQTDEDYRLLRRLPGWIHFGSKTSDTLTRALQTNRGLRVFVASGYYDLVTPLAVVRHTVEEADMTPEQRENIRYKNYEGGHMMYTNLPALEELSKDLRGFIRSAARRKRGPALIPTNTENSAGRTPSL